MKLPIFVLADYATKDAATKKLTIVGVFDKVFANDIPHKHRRFMIVAKMKADAVDTTQVQKVTIEIAHEDSHEPLIEFTHHVQFPIGKNGERPDTDFLLEINDFEFPLEGFYQITISVEGKELGTTPIQIIHKN